MYECKEYDQLKNKRVTTSLLSQQTTSTATAKQTNNWTNNTQTAKHTNTYGIYVTLTHRSVYSLSGLNRLLKSLATKCKIKKNIVYVIFLNVFLWRFRLIGSIDGFVMF